LNELENIEEGINELEFIDAAQRLYNVSRLILLLFFKDN
jgi:hypothetical protein